MEPENDSELRGLLKEWTAPPLPLSLEKRVLRKSWWRVLLGGYIRVPIPVACGLAILMIAAASHRARPQPASPCVAVEKPAPGGCPPDRTC